ncbi:hypothetical protein [Sorangium sp. So ce388]|uniref:hypothetical protein n=1 Tax=Sorangium sp. So ce388 TaxID=3133309 RepID=UPI003F5BB033
MQRRGRRCSTGRARATKTFQELTLLPELRALSEEQRAHLRELAERVTRQAIDEDMTEAAGVPEAWPDPNG